MNLAMAYALGLPLPSAMWSRFGLAVVHTRFCSVGDILLGNGPQATASYCMRNIYIGIK